MDIRKEAESKILETIKEFETETGIQVDFVDVTRGKIVGFQHDNQRPVKNRPVTKCTIKGRIK